LDHADITDIQEGLKKIKLRKDSRTPSVVMGRARKVHVINRAPTDKLDIYVFGNNANAELGLGREVGAQEVTRPRANPLLTAEVAGIVEIATGAQHCVALTHDGKVLTWGANDLGTLGRDTTWGGGYVDIKMTDGDDDGADDDDEEGELNPREVTPTAIDAEYFDGEAITSVAASDNASFVVTEYGHVYSWGTFRVSDQCIRGRL
jgi:regulator of chromosome condensation